MTSPVPCPNCGNLVGPGTPFCHNCGAAMPPTPSAPPPVWPLPPVDAPSFNPYVPPRSSKLVTGSVGGDVALGIILTVLSMFVGGLGLLVMPIVYVLMRANYPAFGRAVGYTFLVFLVLALGALALCFYSLKNI